jgi:surface polysaccharide O-acyltransferase-like enzyme
MFLNSFNHFRAIAIILIVAGHSYVEIPFNTVFNNFLQNLITGGTTLFVFISGFLFHHIFYKNFEYKNFIYKKFQNVYIPYFIMGLIPLFNIIHVDSISQFFKLHLTGGFFIAYWYIPFILAIFLLSPLFVWFIKFNLKTQIIITLIGITISLFIHRPIDNLNVLHSVLYFSPVYLLGIICSMNKQTIYTKLKGKELYLLLAVLVLAFIQSVYIGGGNYHKNLLIYKGIDLLFLQKIILSIFLMVYLHRFENYKNKFIDLLAASSFAIFFIHPYFVTYFGIIRRYYDIHFTYPWLSYPFYLTLIVALSILVAVGIKKILGKNSRFITGY